MTFVCESRYNVACNIIKDDALIPLPPSLAEYFYIRVVFWFFPCYLLMHPSPGIYTHSFQFSSILFAWNLYKFEKMLFFGSSCLFIRTHFTLEVSCVLRYAIFRWCVCRRVHILLSSNVKSKAFFVLLILLLTLCLCNQLYCRKSTK